jgi:hypothetical protein
MRDVKNGKDSAQLVLAIQERIECFHVFGHWRSRPYQAYSSGKLPTSRSPPPLFDHLRELLNYGIAKTCVRSQSFEAKGIANSKLLWIRWFNTSNNACVATDIDALSIHGIAATLTQDYSVPFPPQYSLNGSSECLVIISHVLSHLPSIQFERVDAKFSKSSSVNKWRTLAY